MLVLVLWRCVTTTVLYGTGRQGQRTTFIAYVRAAVACRVPWLQQRSTPQRDRAAATRPDGTIARRPAPTIAKHAPPVGATGRAARQSRSHWATRRTATEPLFSRRVLALVLQARQPRRHCFAASLATVAFHVFARQTCLQFAHVHFNFSPRYSMASCTREALGISPVRVLISLRMALLQNLQFAQLPPVLPGTRIT